MADGGPEAAPLDLGTLDEIRPGAWLAPGHQMVVNDRLVQDRHFAHRITERELVAGWLEVVPDFAPVAAFSHRYVMADGAEVHVIEPEADERAPHDAPGLVLRGPEGWLDAGFADATVIISVDGSALTLEWELGGAPTDLDPTPVVATFERLGDGQPVPLLDLVLHLLIDHPQLFDATPASLQDLLATADLAVRGTTVLRIEAGARARNAEPVGVPGLGLESGLAAERLLGALIVAGTGQPLDADVLVAVTDPDAVSAMAEQVVGGALVEPDRLGLLVDELAAAASAPARPSVAFLRSRLAEWRGNASEQETTLEEAVRSGQLPAALVDAAWFAADRGDARGALALLRSGNIPADDPDAQLLARYTAVGPRTVGRNDPCWCGSGRKHKQCCLRLNGHDLASRSLWLHAKAVSFLQRPPQRAELLAVAMAHAAVAAPEDAPARVIAAACDATVAELCLFEGGAFDRFVDQRGALLPDDERGLAETWRGAGHRVWEIVGDGELRDHVDGRSRTVDAVSAARLPAGGLILAVVHDGPLALPGSALPIAAASTAELVPLLQAGRPAPIAALLGREFGWTAAPDLGSDVDRAPSELAAPAV